MIKAKKETIDRQSAALIVSREFIIIAVIAAQAFQLNYSAMSSFSAFFGMGLAMILMNTLVIAAVNLLFRLLFRGWESTLLFTGILFLLWSIANYYVIEFHGSPLFITEFMNFRAAAAVAGGYRYTIGKAVIGLLLVFAVELILIGCLRFLLRRQPEEKAKGKMLACGLFVLTCLAVYAGLLSPFSVKPHSTMGLSWYNGVKKYGFVSCTIEDCGKLLHKYVKPEGYSPNAISVSGKTDAVLSEGYPDIILILNETFCDLNVYSHVLEEDLFQPLRENDQMIMGYAVTPGIGGLTNNSEYELLTSNSAKLLSFASPFSFVDLEATGENVVRLVRQLQYDTYGMHCCPGVNYSRETAYPALGFETVVFGKEGFPHYNTYGNRPWLDSDNYRDLISYYENAGQNPRFMYLLTFQNHGGWEQNPAEYDTVHCVKDLGALTDDVDEYLSSVSLSVDAFLELADYYSQAERHVIICMVGDHAPSFISELPVGEDYSTEEAEIAKRLVPYVLWANYDVEYPENTEYASMTDLVPMLLQTAGLPLTPYDQYVLDLHNVLPIRTSTGIYRDRDGNIGTYGASSPYFDLMTQYYYMEYNALKAGSEYRKELFELSEMG